MAPPHQPEKPAAASPDPSTIPAFDRVMRGLIHVQKSELPADKRKAGKSKAKAAKAGQ